MKIQDNKSIPCKNHYAPCADTKYWKRFLLHEIFDVDAGNAFNYSEMSHSNPEILFVSRTALNNGIRGIVDKYQEVAPYPSGLLTLALGGSIGSCFVQDDEFYTSQNIAVLTPKQDMSFEAKIFIAKIINNECKTRYQAFGRELNSHIKTDLSIKLPQTATGDVDLKYITEYMMALQLDAEAQLDKILKISCGFIKKLGFVSNRFSIADLDALLNYDKHVIPMQLHTEGWRFFRIGDLFRTETGGDTIKGALEEGDIPVVTHSAKNNGIGFFSDVIEGQKLFDHTKTLSLADRGTFYATVQPDDFYIGTRVKALVARFECDMHILMFVAVIINNEQFRFNYGRNCTGSLDDLKIALPVMVSENGEIIIDNNKTYSLEGYIPDWDYMRKFIKSLPYGSTISG